MCKGVSVIIPAYNEEDYIDRTLANLNFSWIEEIIVVNDGSSDNTAKVAGRYPVKIINLENNKGKGRAVEEGIKASKGEIILLIDADLGESVKEIELVVKPVLHKQVEVTVAVISLTGGGLGLVRWAAHRGLRFLTGTSMEAPLSGQRAISRESLNKIMPLQKGFGLELGMDIAMIKNKVSFKEVSCNLNHRITGKTAGGFFHRGKQFISILLVLWKMRKEWQKEVAH